MRPSATAEPGRAGGRAPRRDGVRFCGLFSLYAVVAFTALYAGQDAIVAPINRHLARLAEMVLRVLGTAASSSGPAVTVPGFAVEIKNSCNAVYEIALYAAAVWAYPATVREHVVGTAIGAAVLYAVNVLRVLALIGLGVYAREWFDLAHLYAWQLLFLSVVAVCWFSWVLRVRPVA